MGVINITPNSFSDGGMFNSPKQFIEQIEEFKKWDVEVYDVGAESTAPFNTPISASVELERLQNIFLEAVDKIPEEAILSVDTYRATTFKSVYNAIKVLRPNAKIWWNDVSGVLDDELFETLNSCPDAQYIFCHTLTPKRIQSSDHMDFILDCDEGDEYLEIKKRFIEALAIFKEKGLSERVMLDPCFGFSKTLEQNLSILRDLPKLMRLFSPDISWVIGISRKSFLKKSVKVLAAAGTVATQVEYIHSAYLSQLFTRVEGRTLYVRAHDPSVIKNAIFITNLF